MKILVACEESQRVCKAFREKGHIAYSCDVEDCSGGHPEWHIKQDVLPLLNGFCEFDTMDGAHHKLEQRWDMILAFPPCTHLATSGARHFEQKRADGRQREGIEFFAAFLNADCDKVIIENPVGIISGEYIRKWFPDLCAKYGLPKKPTQIIQPWMWGDAAQKTTCLWEKGVAPLVPAIKEKPELEFFEWVDKKTGKTKRQHLFHYSTRDGKERSKTFNGIALAMAEQWG